MGIKLEIKRKCNEIFDTVGTHVITANPDKVKLADDDLLNRSLMKKLQEYINENTK